MKTGSCDKDRRGLRCAHDPSSTSTRAANVRALSAPLQRINTVLADINGARLLQSARLCVGHCIAHASQPCRLTPMRESHLSSSHPYTEHATFPPSISAMSGPAADTILVLEAARYGFQCGQKEQAQGVQESVQEAANILSYESTV